MYVFLFYVGWQNGLGNYLIYDVKHHCCPLANSLMNGTIIFCPTKRAGSFSFIILSHYYLSSMKSI